MNLTIKDTRNGKGLFTENNIEKDSIIIEFTGDLFDFENVPNHPAVIQLNHNIYMGPSGDKDDFINHSCNPNCYIKIVGNRAFLCALYFIKKETELTYDYSISSSENKEEWVMNCNCGSINCRGEISGIYYLPPDVLKPYEDRKLIPFYLSDLRFGNI